MSLHEYLYSKTLTFYELVFSLLRKADSDNLEKIKAVWPERYAEFIARYHAPGGVLPEGDFPV